LKSKFQGGADDGTSTGGGAGSDHSIPPPHEGVPRNGATAVQERCRLHGESWVRCTLLGRGIPKIILYYLKLWCRHSDLCFEIIWNKKGSL